MLVGVYNANHWRCCSLISIIIILYMKKCHMQIHPIYMLMNQRKRARIAAESTSPTLRASIIHLEEMVYSLTRKSASVSGSSRSTFR